LGDGADEDDIINKVTKRKVPKKRKELGAKVHPVGGTSGDSSQFRKPASPLKNMPPKRIKPDNSKDMFPSLAVSSTE